VKCKLFTLFSVQCTCWAASGVTIARWSATVSLGLSQQPQKKHDNRRGGHSEGEFRRFRSGNGGDCDPKAAWSSKVRWRFLEAKWQAEGQGHAA